MSDLGSPITIGIDIGGTKCLALARRSDGAIVAESRTPTAKGDASSLVDAIVAVVHDLCRDLPDAVLQGVGLGVPGLVTSTGVLRYAPHLPSAREVALRELLERRLGVRVAVDNDNTAATWAEHRVGAGVGHDELVYVGFGTGIGGGIVHEGRLGRGAHGFAGEMGHMTVDRSGERCVCGRVGCWELVASGSALTRLAGRPGEQVTAAAAAGDTDALALIDRFAAAVAVGLADLVQLLDPSLVVLGGGVMDPPDVIVPAVVRAFTSEMGDAGAHRALPGLVPARLGNRAAAIGAALLATEPG